MKKLLIFIAFFFSLSILEGQDNNTPDFYLELYKTEIESNPEKAFSILKQGRILFPNDLKLFTKSIWHSLRLGEFDNRINKLEEEITQDSQNLFSYYQLAKAYEIAYDFYNLLNDDQKVLESFNNGVKVYKVLIDLNPNSFEANYKLGASYFRKGVDAVKKNQSLGIPKKTLDISAALLEFEKSLPYFQKAESLNPNDLNVLIALSEVYARKQEFEISKEMRKRKEIVMEGGKNSESYFRVD